MQFLYVSVYEAAICQPKHLLDSYTRWQDDGALPRNYIRLAVFQCPDRGNFSINRNLVSFRPFKQSNNLRRTRMIVWIYSFSLLRNPQVSEGRNISLLFWPEMDGSY